MPLLSVSIVMGIFLNCYISLFYGRVSVNITFGGVIVIGALLLNIMSDNAICAQIALYMISFVHYAVCISTACLIFEIVEVKAISYLLWAFVLFYHIGKFVTILLIYQFDGSVDSDSDDNQSNEDSDSQVMYNLVIGVIGLIFCLGSFFYK
jgi:hypothetical protein